MHSVILLCGIVMTIFVIIMPSKDKSQASQLQSTNPIKNNLKQFKKVLNTEVEPSKMTQNKCSYDEEVSEKKVIKINVGGEIITCTRDVLTRVHNSKLASMIYGNCTDIPAFDSDGNIFLDYNPSLFRYLLEQLRTLKDGDSLVFYPPRSRLIFLPFKQMLEELGLQIAPCSDDDIITLNVGGEIFVTRRRILTRIPHSKLAIIVSSYRIVDTDANGYVFLDYDAQLFRYLLSQLRSSHYQQTCKFQALSFNDTEAFNTMLNDLGLINSTTNTINCPPKTAQLLSHNVKITASNFCNTKKTSCVPSTVVAEKINDILYPNRSNHHHWNSAGYAPQYIQMELEKEESISHVFLQISQTPNGHTHHSFLIGSEENALRQVKVLTGNTINHNWINLTFHPPLERVRFLRINTLSSPSWVAWYKFLVYKN